MVPEIGSTTDTIFCYSGPFFALFPLWTQKIKKKLKMEKTPEDIIIHMMYGSSDMECNGQNFLSFWTIFCPFTPLTTRKI